MKLCVQYFDLNPKNVDNEGAACYKWNGWNMNRQEKSYTKKKKKKNEVI